MVFSETHQHQTSWTEALQACTESQAVSATIVQTQPPDVLVFSAAFADIEVDESAALLGLAFSPSAAAAALVAVLAVLSITFCLQTQSCYQYYVHCSWVEPISHARICFKMVHLGQSCNENLHHTTAERRQDYCIPNCGPSGIQCMWLRPHPCPRPSSPRLLSAEVWLG